MNEKPDFIFKCKKCNHRIYVGKDRVYKMLDYDCPECGEEGDELWILIDEGDYDAEN